MKDSEIVYVFEIRRKKLDDIQKWLILHHEECSEAICHEGYIFRGENGKATSEWDIKEGDISITGQARSNKFDMKAYFELCGIDAEITEM